MDRTLKIYLAVLVAVVLLVVIVDSSRKKPVDWRQTYSLDDKKPYDLYVFNNELDSLTDKTVIRSAITPYEYITSTDSVFTYVIIRPNVYSTLDSAMFLAIEAGSNLFVSAEGIERSFWDEIDVRYTDIDFDISILENDTAHLSMTTNKEKGKSYALSPVNNTFCFVKIDQTTSTVLGSLKLPNDEVYPNFIHVKYGKGNIYVHSLPQVFTNYELLKPESSAGYVAEVLSFIPRDKPIVWFVKGQTTKIGRPINTSPLSVIFRYPALRATWLVFLYGLLLFVFFNSKRRQRVIPVIKPLKNTTVEFTQTIGNLYYQEGDIVNILEKKVIYFLDRLRSRYYLDTRNLDESFIEKLHLKSGKDKILIRYIVNFINRFENQKSASRHDLTQLNDWIERFWEE